MKSVSSTLQLTNAMGLVASSKIRRANESMNRARAYRASLNKALSPILSDPESLKSPYMQIRQSGKTALIVIAGDRGMAGGYNANVFRLVASLPESDYLPIGKRACDRYGKSFISSEKYTMDNAFALADELCTLFASGELDRIGIVYTKYNSVMSQEAELKWLLPLEPTESNTASSAIFEPDKLTVLDLVVREYLAGSIVSYVRESFACEVSARRMAMDSAGKNAKEMLDNLGLEYNRARQSAITQEITEIVAGSGN